MASSGGDAKRAMGWLCAALLVLGAVSSGCTQDGDSSVTDAQPGDVLDGGGQACEGGQRTVMLMHKISFGREVAPGVSVGADLDGVTSDTQDASGCFQADFVSEDGQEGIDNQFARILPGLEAVGGEAIEDIIKGAISSGELLLMFQMEHLDRQSQDECVDVTVLQGKGQPEIGTDDLIEVNQTFDPDFSAPMAKVQGASIEDGKLLAGPVEFSLPIFVFGFDLVFNIRRAVLQAQWQRDGTMKGFISGSISVTELLEIVEGIDGGGQITELLEVVLAPSADLFPDEEGICSELSITLVFEAIPAFFYEDALPELDAFQTP